MKKHLLFGFRPLVWGVALLLSVGAYAQPAPRNTVFRFVFRVSDSQLLLGYGSNKQQAARLDSLVGIYGVGGIKNVTLSGVCSPDGRLLFNDQVSYLRAKNLRDFLRERYRGLAESLIRVNEQGDNFAELKRVVEADRSFPRRQEVLDAVCKNSDKEARQFALLGLLSLPDVRAYAQEALYPKLRYTYLCDVLVRRPNADWSLAADTVYATAAVFDSLTKANRRLSGVQVSDGIRQRAPLFALKTNLLFDLATLLNLEIEIPIGKRWSVAVEAVFPWWLSQDHQSCLQILTGSVEGRYWFPPRKASKRGLFPTMTGWFVGAYAGAGLYDIEYQKSGYRGDFTLSVGLTAGYAHSIGKHLRMEYSIGVGYMQTNYRRYEARFLDLDQSWHLYNQELGLFRWIGPTKAKISLVWLLNRNVTQKQRVR